MTWYFDAQGQTLDIYDHTGTLVAEGREFSGSWSGYPAEVATVLNEEVVDAVSIGNIPYAITAVSDLAAEDIEQGTP